jgi:hypothetical protein
MRWMWAQRRTALGRLSRVAAFIAGVAVLYHEIWIADSAEPLLVFLGLWLCGLPPAIFFDGLRKLGADAKGALTADTSGLPNTNGLPTAKADPELQEDAERQQRRRNDPWGV